MPTRKIDDIVGKVRKECKHSDHKPCNDRVIEPGTYKHTCPACNQETYFTIQKMYWL